MSERRVHMPTRDEISLLDDRRQILSARIAAFGKRQELFAALEAVPIAEAKHVVQELLGVSELGADAVLAMQVRRFTTSEREKIQYELADVEARRRALDTD